MKVAFIHHYSLSYGGGGERFLIDLSNHLNQQGHKVEIHTLPFNRNGGSIDLQKGIHYCELPIHRIDADVYYYVFVPLLNKIAVPRNDSPKIAGVHSIAMSGTIESTAHYLSRGPLVGVAWILRNAMQKKAFGNYSAIHTVNSTFSVPDKPIYFIPNWVDRSHSESSIKQKMNEKAKTFRVLFAGNPSYTKGYDLFAQVSEAFHDDDIEFVCTSRSVQPGGRVKFAGFLPQLELLKMYADSAVLLHPTRAETFGKVILESMSAGTPVITTSIQSHTSLGLPLIYADTVEEMVLAIKGMYVTWKNHYDQYVGTSQALAQSTLKFDRQTILPRFENMFVNISSSIT